MLPAVQRRAVAPGEGSLGHVHSASRPSSPGGGWWAGDSPCVFPQGQTSSGLGSADRSPVLPGRPRRRGARVWSCAPAAWVVASVTGRGRQKSRTLRLALCVTQCVQVCAWATQSWNVFIPARDQVPSRSPPESWQLPIFCVCEFACSVGFLEMESDRTCCFWSGFKARLHGGACQSSVPSEDRMLSRCRAGLCFVPLSVDGHLAVIGGAAGTFVCKLCDCML